MPSLLAYALLFAGISAFFIFSHLMIGKLVRPNRPDAEKKTIYECGEPTIGTSWIQFDLRFYVVALLFVIFDVEMAFFFPWAVVFGKANQLSDRNLSGEQRLAINDELGPRELWSSSAVEKLAAGAKPLRYQRFEESVRKQDRLLDASERENLTQAQQAELKRTKAPTPAESNWEAARSFAVTAFLDIFVFFGVLLVGFAYLWRRGDLDWVRSVAAQKSEVRGQTSEVGSHLTSDF